MSSEQLQQMIDLLQQQMTTVNNLQTENTRLREANNTATMATETGSTGPSAGGEAYDRRYKSKKPDRPVINTDLDDQEWVLFLDTWDRYKSMIELQPTDTNAIRMELRTACSEDVNKLLFEYVGASKLKTCTEDELLGHIKSVAVKVTHKEVHRVEFAKMIQNEGEKATHYVARLNAKAFLCKFTVQCEHQTEVSYSDDMVALRLLAGLRNQEHKTKLLSEAATLVTLDDKVKRLQVLESTEESATLLHNPAPPSTALANRSASTYKTSKKVSPPQMSIAT